MFQGRSFVCFITVLVLSSCHKQVRRVSAESDRKLSPFFDVRPSVKPVSYFYAPGFQATEVAMGRLCPSFTAVTGEKITWKAGIHVIDEPHSAVVFPEIDLKKPTCFTLNPLKAVINNIRCDLASLAL